MKLFWGSIVFIAVASFTPLAFGQSTTTWNSNNGLVYGNYNPSGNYTDASKWSNGVPTSSLIANIEVFNITTGGLYLYGNNNNTITVTVPTGQSAAALYFNSYFTTPQGTINFNFNPGATYTLGGPSLATLSPSLMVEFGTIGNINGGNISVLTGFTAIGSPNTYWAGGETDVLNLSQTNITYQAGTTGIILGPILGGETGILNQANNSTITAGSNFTVLVNSGSYNMTNGSTLTLGATGTLQVYDGSFNQDATSTVNLANNSEVRIGGLSSSTSTYNLAGNLNVTNTQINVGAFTTAGTLNQTGGNISGSASLNIGGNGGVGTYNLTGGTANFSQGLSIGQRIFAGTGTLNQSGNSTLTTGGTTAIIGTLGTGFYNLSGGTADFQAGVTVGANGTIVQSGNSSLSSEGPTTIAGVYTLAGGNAYMNNTMAVSGVLNLSGGTLQVGVGSLTGAGTLNFGGGTLRLVSGPGALPPYALPLAVNLVSGTSTIDVSGSSLGTFNFSSALSGAGGINLVGNGSTIFNFASAATPAANNTFTGAAGISSGLLNATQNDIASTSSLNLGAGGILNLALNPGGMQYVNNVGGSGQLYLNFNPAAPGTIDSFVMSNSSGFNGTVTLGVNGNAGNLQIYNGTFNGIGDNGTGSSVTIGGPALVGAAAVPLSGTVYMPGANTYTGMTVINPGFTVRSSNFSGSVTNAGATLGTLGSFTSPGSMTIGGNLVSSGTILVGTNGHIADTYTVNGGGVSQLSGVVSTVGSGTNKYAVITTTTGSITIGGNGKLNNSKGLDTNPALTLFSSYLTLDPTGHILYVNTVQKPLANFAKTPNQLAVANALDPLTQSPPIEFAPLLTIFNFLPASQIAPALEELTPESLQFSRNIAFENSTMLVQKVNGALADMRAGYSGLDTSGISVSAPGFEGGLGHSLGAMLASNAPSFHTTAPNGVNYYPDDGGNTVTPTPVSDYDEPVHPSRMTPSRAASPTTYDGQTISDSPPPMKAAPPNIKTSRFSEFVAGDVVLNDINQTKNMSSNASYTAGDILAGVGFRVTSNLTAGVLFDYNHTNAKTDSSGSKTTVDSITPGIFATYAEKGFYANGIFGFGFNQYQNNRNVSFLGGTANSSPNGQQYTLDGDVGYDFQPRKDWVVGPTLGLTYTHLNVDSFSESGVPLADLNVNSQSVDSLRSRLGGHIEYITRVGNIFLQPNISAAWQHEYLDNGPGITSSFQAYPTASPFTINAAPPTSDSALVSCGLTATLDNSMAFYLTYVADVGGGNYLAQSIIAGVKGSF